MLKRFLALIVITLILAAASAEADSLKVRPSGNVSAYSDNTLQITAPSAGVLTVVIGDEYSEYRHLSFDVESGSQTLHWDGLADDGQRIGRYNGKYTMTSLLTAPGGETWKDSTQIEVARSGQFLLFALPSRKTLVPGEEWYVELQAMRKGKDERILMSVAAADAPDSALFTRDIQVKTTDIFLFKWDGKNGKTPLEPGQYLLTFRTGENDAHTFPLTIAAEKEAAASIEETGDIMPSLWMSDEELWSVMQRPSVVVDAKATAKQKVFTEASRSSKAVGTVYGQTQAVQVLSVSKGWAKVTVWSQENGESITGYLPLDKLKVVRPDDEYGLLIDKNTQTMTVFRYGKRIAELPVSTGLVAKGKLNRETAAGMFLTGDRQNEYTVDKITYSSCIRIAGPNMIESVGFKKVGTHADYAEQSACLGQKASLGGIRLTHVPDKDTAIDAWWLYSHLPTRTRVVILDDPYVRRVQASTVKAGGVIQPYLTQGSDRSEIPDFPESAQIITVTFGGDAVIGTREVWMKREDAFPACLEANGMAYPFSGLQQVFAHDDLTMVNLECVLKSNKAGEDKEKWFRFRGMPSWAQVLNEGSIEHVNIANNHYIDYGAAGKKSTREALTEAGIPYSGYGFTYIYEQDGHKIGFAGIRETTYFQVRGQIAEDIRALREAGCEVVVYTCHWGVEYSAAHNDIQMEIARVAVEAGADLVIGGHPHVVQGISVMDGTPIIWSLGNLMFGGTIELTEFDAMLVRSRFVFEEGAYKGCALELLPILISGKAAEGLNDYRPVISDGADKYRVLQKIQADSDFPITQEMWFPKN